MQEEQELDSVSDSGKKATTSNVNNCTQNQLRMTFFRCCLQYVVRIRIVLTFSGNQGVTNGIWNVFE